MDVGCGPSVEAEEWQPAAYSLCFHVTQSQPHFAEHFLQTGGSLTTAAADGETDFHVTGGKHAVAKRLHRTQPVYIEIELPTEIVTLEESGIVLSTRSKLNVASQRVGVAINGTLVDTRAGSASVYLSTLLRRGDSHYQHPLVYGSTASHSCTLGFSGISILNAKGMPVNVRFEKPSDEDEATIEAAVKCVNDWASKAWDLRGKKLVYALSPTLTKSVGRAPVGVGDCGFELVHNIMDQDFAFKKATLNSLLQNAIASEVGFESAEIDRFLEMTAKPGLDAASWMHTIASAMSIAASFLVAYRADGRTVMGARGSEFTETESWLRSPARTPMEANDCDGSALVICSALQTAVDSSEEDRAKYPYLRAVRNALVPYYTFGVSVVGATSAEASGGGGGKGVAGHAVALMLPTASLLGSLHKAAAQHSLAGEPISAASELVRAARHDAMFSPDLIAALPPEERTLLELGPEALRGDLLLARKIQRLRPFAMEGTTPADAALYEPDSANRSAAESEAVWDSKAFRLSVPNVGRGIKLLHVGSGGHRFYHDFVEVTFHCNHPLYANQALRAMGEAASQFVLAETSSSRDLSAAGASPERLFKGEYVAVPLCSINKETGRVLDFAAHLSKQDVIPARANTLVLSKEQSEDLSKSVAALKALGDNLGAKQEDGHCVTHILAYSTILNNPLAVEHFCTRIAQASVCGYVDVSTVLGLAKTETGDEAGHFVVVNSICKV
jgi:hypothetical protein